MIRTDGAPTIAMTDAPFERRVTVADLIDGLGITAFMSGASEYSLPVTVAEEIGENFIDAVMDHPTLTL